MLTAYIRAAMARARYRMLEEDEGFFGEVIELPGLWANAPTLEACRDELQSALEGWLALGLRMGHSIPVLDGVDFSIISELEPA